MRVIRAIVLLLIMLFVCRGIFAGPEFEVTGIIHKDKPMAIINGKILQEGDEINEAIVEKINDNSVNLRYKGKIIVKNVSGRLRPANKTSGSKSNVNAKQQKWSFLNQKVSPIMFILIVLLAGGGAFFLSKKNKK